MTPDTCPFFVVENFMSPLVCETAVDSINLTVPDYNSEGTKPIISVLESPTIERLVFNRLEMFIPKIEQRYGVQYKGTHSVEFQWLAQGCEGEAPHAENSEFLREKWLRIRDNDLTGVVFLSDFNDNTPFDGEFEVYGGKHEFPQHGFGFQPQRGTLVVFPSAPHFVNHTLPIIVGDLYRVKFYISTQVPYLYDPNRFPGDYSTWFKGYQ